MMDKTVKYRIVDLQTKSQVGTLYNNRKRAHTRADRLDMEYGAYRYMVEPVWLTPKANQTADTLKEER